MTSLESHNEALDFEDHSSLLPGEPAALGGISAAFRQIFGLLGLSFLFKRRQYFALLATFVAIFAVYFGAGASTQESEQASLHDCQLRLSDYSAPQVSHHGSSSSHTLQDVYKRSTFEGEVLQTEAETKKQRSTFATLRFAVVGRLNIASLVDDVFSTDEQSSVANFLVSTGLPRGPPLVS